MQAQKAGHVGAQQEGEEGAGLWGGGSRGTVAWLRLTTDGCGGVRGEATAWRCSQEAQVAVRMASYAPNSGPEWLEGGGAQCLAPWTLCPPSGYTVGRRGSWYDPHPA